MRTLQSPRTRWQLTSSTPHVSIIPPSTSTSTSTSNPLSSSLESIPGLQVAAYPPFIPGGGLSRRILSALQGSSIPHAAIGAWCVEGDNRDDAYALASTVLHALGRGELTSVRLWSELTPGDTQLREPEEWAGLFGVVEGWSGGAGADAELYG